MVGLGITWILDGFEVTLVGAIARLAEGLLDQVDEASLPIVVSVLKAQLRGEVIVEPIVYTLDEGTLSRYERRVLVH